MEHAQASVFGLFKPSLVLKVRLLPAAEVPLDMVDIVMLVEFYNMVIEHPSIPSLRPLSVSLISVGEPLPLVPLLGQAPFAC